MESLIFLIGLLDSTPGSLGVRVLTIEQHHPPGEESHGAFLSFKGGRISTARAAMGALVGWGRRGTTFFSCCWGDAGDVVGARFRRCFTGVRLLERAGRRSVGEIGVAQAAFARQMSAG